ncbi:MAG: hypothetical protein RSA27_01430 [Oscillospiraceae bacterium]
MSKNSEKEKEYDIKFNLSNTDSATDCTGLIQVAPLAADQLDSYNGIYNYGAPNIFGVEIFSDENKFGTENEENDY